MSATFMTLAAMIILIKFHHQLKLIYVVLTIDLFFIDSNLKLTSPIRAINLFLFGVFGSQK